MAPFEGNKKPLIGRGGAFLGEAGGSVSIRRGAVSLELSGKFGEIQAELLDVMPVDSRIDPDVLLRQTPGLPSSPCSGRMSTTRSIDSRSSQTGGIPTAAPTATKKT